MKPVRLTLSGFLSYRSETTLDFTQFDLACISGENGAGKSSLLDAITWVLFGVARTRDDSLINLHPTVQAARVTLDFYYEGNLYRVQRTSPRGKTTMLEFHIQVPGGGWKALTERTSRATQERIIEVLRMDYETFVNASFFLQGHADQFTTQPPGKRKEILGKILGLEAWETYRDRAAEKRKEREDELLQINGRLREIEIELNEEDTRKAALAEMEARLADLSAQLQAQEKALESIRQLTAAMEGQKRQVETLERQLAEDQRRLDDLRTRLQDRLGKRAEYQQALEHAAEIRAAHARLQEVRTALVEKEKLAERHRKTGEKRQAPLLAIERERSRLESERNALRKQFTDLQTALAGRPALEEKLRLAQEREKTVQAQAARCKEIDQELPSLLLEQRSLTDEKNRLKTELTELKSRVDQLEEFEGAVCPFCGQPLSPADRERLVQELTAEGTSKKAIYNQLLENLQTLEPKINALKAEQTQLGNVQNLLVQVTNEVILLNRQLEELDQKEATWQAAGAPELERIEKMLANEDFAHEARQELRQIDEELAASGYRPAEHEALHQEEQSLRHAEEDLRKLESAAAALVPLEEEIQDIQKQVAAQETRLDRQKQDTQEAQARLAQTLESLPDVAQAERAVQNLKAQEGRLRMDLGGARQKVSVLDTLRERRAALEEQRAVVATRITHYKQLERAFGKDGVPAMLIEQALPQIEIKANEILDRLSNGAMSVHFETQRDYKDTKRTDKKETLDILISDSVGLRDYEMYSGGEAFRVNFAIRLALSEVLAQRAGARLQTLVIDEGFGSQDATGRQRLVEAINLVRSDFEKILVITHIDELKDAFPARIEVEKTSTGSVIHVT